MMRLILLIFNNSFCISHYSSHSFFTSSISSGPWIMIGFITRSLGTTIFTWSSSISRLCWWKSRYRAICDATRHRLVVTRFFTRKDYLGFYISVSVFKAIWLVQTKGRMFSLSCKAFLAWSFQRSVVKYSPIISPIILRVHYCPIFFIRQLWSQNYIPFICKHSLSFWISNSPV